MDKGPGPGSRGPFLIRPAPRGTSASPLKARLHPSPRVVRATQPAGADQHPTRSMISPGPRAVSPGGSQKGRAGATQPRQADLRSRAG